MLEYDFATGNIQLVSGGDMQQEQMLMQSQQKVKEEESPSLKKGMTKAGN